MAQLSWVASAGPDVLGYRIYYGSATGTYDQPPGIGVPASSASSHTVTGLAVGKTYYFVVTAVDASGNESGYSNEVSKLVW